MMQNKSFFILKLLSTTIRYSINEKAFVANTEMFFRMQREFESKGFLLLVKQSDKNKFSNEYRTATALLDRSAALISRFSLSNKHRAADFFHSSRKAFAGN